MVPDPGCGGPRLDARLYHDEIEPKWQVGERLPVGELATIQQSERGRPHACAFAVVDRFFGKAECAADPPADFDDHERSRRARVDRHEVKLVTTDMDVPGQDGPAGVDESGGDQRFGGVTRLLCGSPTGIEPWRIIHGSHHGPGRLPGTLLRMHSHSIEQREIQRVEGCRIDHHRNEFPFQQRMGRRRCGWVAHQIQVQLITGEGALEGQE